MDTSEMRAAPANAAPSRATTCVMLDPRKIDPGECKSRRVRRVEWVRLVVPNTPLPALPALTALPAPLQPRAHPRSHKWQETSRDQNPEPGNQRHARDDLERHRRVLAGRNRGGAASVRGFEDQRVGAGDNQKRNFHP